LHASKIFNLPLAQDRALRVTPDRSRGRDPTRPGKGLLAPVPGPAFEAAKRVAFRMVVAHAARPAVVRDS
jgi:hypothetical protein